MAAARMPGGATVELQPDDVRIAVLPWKVGTKFRVVWSLSNGAAPPVWTRYTWHGTVTSKADDHVVVRYEEDVGEIFPLPLVDPTVKYHALIQDEVQAREAAPHDKDKVPMAACWKFPSSWAGLTTTSQGRLMIKHSISMGIQDEIGTQPPQVMQFRSSMIDNIIAAVELSPNVSDENVVSYLLKLLCDLRMFCAEKKGLKMTEIIKANMSLQYHDPVGAAIIKALGETQDKDKQGKSKTWFCKSCNKRHQKGASCPEAKNDKGSHKSK
jgi:hypothetical protein